MTRLRSLLHWTLAFAFFVPVCTFVVALGSVIDPRRFDPLVRWMMRSVVRLAGGRLEVKRADGFDPARTSFFVSNHVNLLDPFVLYAAIPQFVRGLELESHFKVPVYGWLMGRFGNVPVPDKRTAEGLKRTYRLTREALERDVSLIVFPEGGRTLDGSVGEFEEGVFRMAKQLGCPIVPVSIVGSYRWKRKGSKLLRPGPITVHLHDTIDVGALDRAALRALGERVQAIVAEPVAGRA